MNGMSDDKLKKVKEEIKERVLKNSSLSQADDDGLERGIRQEIERYYEGSYVSIADKAALCDDIFSSIRGLGLLDSILADEEITEIMINGAKEIFVEKAGRLTRLAEVFESEDKLLNIARRIVAEGGREVSEANPIVDVSLSDGSRVNVVLPPISRSGTIVTIRKFSKEPMTVDKLIEYGSITPEIADVLRLLVRAKYNIIVCGGTGSGKTTFLNAISNFIPGDERVITIEDSAELQIVTVENLVSLQTRNANTAGVGTVNIRDLIKSALRMRPDRIIVGEVRGEEALDMLQAMNTGHDGSLSTGHANSTRDMLSRLETMVLTGAEGLPLEAVRKQIASAVDIIIHLSRLRDRSRKTMEITEVAGFENHEIVLNPLYIFEESEDSALEHVRGFLNRTKNLLKNDLKLKRMGYYGTI